MCLVYLYVRPSKLTFMTAGASAPHVGVRVAFQSGSRRSQNSQCVSRLRAARSVTSGYLMQAGSQRREVVTQGEGVRAVADRSSMSAAQAGQASNASLRVAGCYSRRGSVTHDGRRRSVVAQAAEHCAHLEPAL